MLPTDGNQLSEAESRLLGEILKASNIEFRDGGVNIQHLLNGKSGLAYGEMQFVMKGNPTTRILSINLKQELQSSELGMQYMYVVEELEYNSCFHLVIVSACRRILGMASVVCVSVKICVSSISLYKLDP